MTTKAAKGGKNTDPFVDPNGQTWAFNPQTKKHEIVNFNYQSATPQAQDKQEINKIETALIEKKLSFNKLMINDKPVFILGFNQKLTTKKDQYATTLTALNANSIAIGDRWTNSTRTLIFDRDDFESVHNDLVIPLIDLLVKSQ